MNLQIAITDRCNLQCAHCHSACENGNFTYLDDSFIRHIILQNSQLNEHIEGNFRLFLTGGEPFLHPNIRNLIDFACNFDKIEAVAIFTNGLLIDHETTEFIRQYKNLHIQISIDGLKKSHDRIRGSGTYEKVRGTVDLLAASGVPFVVATTVGKWNLPEVPDLICASQQMGAKAFLTHRFIPTGRGQHNAKFALSQMENLSLYQKLLAYEADQKNGFHVVLDNCSICSIRSLLAEPQIPDAISGGCHIGTTCIHVDSDYNMITCPKARMVIGDLRSMSLMETFFNSPLLAKFRARDFGKYCGRCALKNLCGGCRALAYYYTNNIFGDELICPLISGGEIAHDRSNHLSACRVHFFRP